MSKNIEQQIDNYVGDWCWNNLPGDDLWDNNVYGHVLEGVKIAEKGFKKKLKDLYNKYSSHLIDEQRVKLSKIINEAKVRELKAKLEVLKELERKLELPHTK